MVESGAGSPIEAIARRLRLPISSAYKARARAIRELVALARRAKVGA